MQGHKGKTKTNNRMKRDNCSGKATPQWQLLRYKEPYNSMNTMQSRNVGRKVSIVAKFIEVLWVHF